MKKEFVCVIIAVFSLTNVSAQNLFKCPELVWLNEELGRTSSYSEVRDKIAKYDYLEDNCYAELLLAKAYTFYFQQNLDSANFFADKIVLEDTMSRWDSLLLFQYNFLLFDIKKEERSWGKAFSILERTLDMTTSFGYSKEEIYLKASTLIRSSNYFSSREDFYTSISILLEVEDYLDLYGDILDRDRLRMFLRAIYLDLGTNYGRIRDIKNAVFYNERTLKMEIEDGKGNSIDLAVSHYNLMGDYYFLEDFENARIHYLEAERIFKNYLPKDHFVFRQMPLFLVENQLKTGDYDSARMLIKKANAFDVLDDHLNIRRVLELYPPANYYSKVGEIDSAFLYIQKSLSILSPEIDDKSIPPLSENGNIDNTLNLPYYIQYLSIKVRLLSQLYRERQQENVLSLLWKTHQDLANSILINKKYFPENSNNRQLLDAVNLHLSRMMNDYFSYPKPLNIRVEKIIYQAFETMRAFELHRKLDINHRKETSILIELSAKLDQSNVLLSECSVKEKCDSLLSVNSRLRLRKISALDSLEKADPSYRSGFSFDLVGLDSAQASLNDTKVILTYAENDSMIFSMKLLSDTVSFSRIKKSSLSTYPSNSLLYDTLMFDPKGLLPIEALSEDISHVYLVPSSTISKIPVFIDQKLGLDYPTISYAVSISSLLNSNKKSERLDSVLVFGYPGRKDIPPGSDSIMFKWYASNARSGNSYLLGVEDELKFFEGWKSTIFSNAQAKESTFKLKASEAELIHIASHAYLEFERQRSQYILFESSDSENGFLTSDEIKSLDLDASLVFLSACNTGVGKYQDGEGIQSLAYSFLYAGAKSVIMTQWKIPDETTPEIVIEFYKNLKKGQRKSVALRNAQLTYLENQEDPLKRHPYFWAGFVLIGDDSPIEFENDTPWWYWLGGGCLLIFFSVLIYRYQKLKAA